MLKIIVVLLLLSSAAFSQSRKDVKKLKIKAVSEDITDAAGNNPYKDAYEAFDANGNTIEKTEYRKDGSIKNRYTRLYDKRDNMLEEIIYKADGSQESKETFVYNSDNDVVEEKKYEGEKLQRWLKSEYNALGNKTVETEYDAEGNLLKRSEYIYDNNDLRKEKRTYNPKKELISIKKYSYRY